MTELEEKSDMSHQPLWPGKVRRATSISVATDGQAENVRVIVRFRPLNAQEAAECDNTESVFDFKRTVVEMRDLDAEQLAQAGGRHHTAEVPIKTFNFDGVHGPDSVQGDLFNEIRSVIDGSFDGINGTVFAYGQTGSGKTYTMDGAMGEPGLMRTAFDYVCNSASHCRAHGIDHVVITVAFYEIYMEEVNDLLELSNGQPTRRQVGKSKDGDFIVKNLKEVEVTSAEQMLHELDTGRNHRKTGKTNANEHSSRSHAVFCINVHTLPEGSDSYRTGKLNFADLAGSECAKYTEATSGGTAQEAAKINKSLLTLKRTIGSIANKSKQTPPFRDSKLTMVLKDSLAGTARTVLIAACSPASKHLMSTKATLNFAKEAKTIKNTLKVHDDDSDDLRAMKSKLDEARREIARYRQELLEKEKALDLQGYAHIRSGFEDPTNGVGFGADMANALQKELEAQRARANDLAEKLAEQNRIRSEMQELENQKQALEKRLQEAEGSNTDDIEAARREKELAQQRADELKDELENFQRAAKEEEERRIAQLIREEEEKNQQQLEGLREQQAILEQEARKQKQEGRKHLVLSATWKGLSDARKTQLNEKEAELVAVREELAKAREGSMSDLRTLTQTHEHKLQVLQEENAEKEKKLKSYHEKELRIARFFQQRNINVKVDVQQPGVRPVLVGPVVGGPVVGPVVGVIHSQAPPSEINVIIDDNCDWSQCLEQFQEFHLEQLRSKDSEMDELRKRLEEMEAAQEARGCAKEEEDIRSKLTKAEEENSALREEVSTLTKTIEATKSELTTAQGETKQAQESEAAVTRTKNALESQLRSIFQTAGHALEAARA